MSELDIRWQQRLSNSLAILDDYFSLFKALEQKMIGLADGN